MKPKICNRIKWPRLTIALVLVLLMVLLVSTGSEIELEGVGLRFDNHEELKRVEESGLKKPEDRNAK